MVYFINMISYEKRQKIITKALSEIEFARNFKQSKTTNWKKNEEMYYGSKKYNIESRSNVDLGQMASFVHTLLSKIDNPMTFKFTKRKPSQQKRVELLNSLRDYDSNLNYWDLKDIAGKKQGIMYGRAVFSYYADSVNGYTSHLENVDVYNFLIDPSAGGIHIDNAQYIGDYGVVLSRKDIENGVKSGKYLRTEANNLLQGSGNSVEETQEVINAKNRTYDTNVNKSSKEIGDPDKYRFWRWGTTFDGERYFLLLTERGGTALQVKRVSEMFSTDSWWYWTWAPFVDLTEFWTPGYCDYVRELFMAQSVSVNQMLDNAEQINKPQKVVNVGAIENLSDLKYRRDGVIRVKKDFDADKAIQMIRVPSIDTPLRVFDLLQTISQGTTGVSDIASGVADPQGKATIYEGNQANEADRFGLLNKSYTFGYKRFAKLWEHGVRDHLIKKVSIDILGPEGVSLTKVSRKDIFNESKDEFGLIVDSSNAEIALTEGDKRAKLQFLSGITGNTAYQINPQKSMEMQAEIVGFNSDEIRQLQDTSEFGDSELMSEAERDIEMILDGKDIRPNKNANSAYMERIVDYIQEHEEDINSEQFSRLTTYIQSLEEIIAQNMVRMANKKLLKEQRMMQEQAMSQVGMNPQGSSHNALPDLTSQEPESII
jgi:hypothetical protein